ncbi:MAG: ABC transporter ATP-binding protein [Methylohalobius sp.]
MPIIEVEHLTKEYQLGTITSFKDSVTNVLRRLAGKPPIERERFKALDDVSFTVEEGEVVGIIGHNGAGKSTLLKILAKVTTPTKGRAVVRGSIAPLIEVGAGINPELTGRENIYLNASILGIPKKIIRQKIDEIIEFSELEQFIDTPVKRYSSGMQVKLGFAIATSLDAEILIIDEVLAVGDLAFQRKCFDRMEELIKRQGKTVLLVSHNLRQIERLCSRTILMDHGRISLDSTPKEVCNRFYEMVDHEIYERMCKNNSNTLSSGDVDLKKIEIFNAFGQSTRTIEYLGPVEIQMTYKINRSIKNPVFGIGVHTTDFLYLATNQSINDISMEKLDEGIYTLAYKINRFPFLPGVYSFRVGVALGNTFQPLYYKENAVQIRVIAPPSMNRSVVSHNGEGFIEFEGKWGLTLKRE